MSPGVHLVTDPTHTFRNVVPGDRPGLAARVFASVRQTIVLANDGAPSIYGVKTRIHTFFCSLERLEPPDSHEYIRIERGDRSAVIFQVVRHDHATEYVIGATDVGFWTMFMLSV